MTGMVANVLMNVVLVGLLCATIGYCLLLNRRIRTLQDSKSELAALLQQFDESTVKASETIVAMQTASKKIGDNIQLRIDKANYLLDDLSFAIEKGTRLTSQIEASFAVNRAKSRVDEIPASAATHALPVMPDEPPVPVAIDKPVEKAPAKAAGKRSPASIEAILEKVVSRKQQMQEEYEATQLPQAANVPSPAGRSRAEQELIELIRSSKG